MLAPLISGIIGVLAKFALDNGAELEKAAFGPKAVETGGKMYALTLDRMRHDLPFGIAAHATNTRKTRKHARSP